MRLREGRGPLALYFLFAVLAPFAPLAWDSIQVTLKRKALKVCLESVILPHGNRLALSLHIDL